MPRPPNPEVRSRLLSMGREVVHERGFNGCGVQDITEAAGVPKGSFYNYFDSKETFAADILEEYWLSIEARHGAILKDARRKPLVRVTRFFRALTHDHARHQFALGCLIGNLSLELSNVSDETRLKVSAILGRWQAALAECLREAQKQGEMPADLDPIEVASVAIEAYEGAVMRGKVDQSSDACDRFEKVVLPRLLR
jgi:TetR/AcrR family transcriptional regulator, transcriptional repressor for nem operon